jgi:hypothetical protein
VGGLWAVLHGKFVHRFVDPFCQTFIRALQSAPDTEIRNLTNERFDRICKSLENLGRRIYTVYSRHTMMENFELMAYTVFLKSNFLQRRIHGLKGINDICINVRKSMSFTIQLPFLTDWVVKERFLEELFGPRKHQQILRRSAPILILLYEGRLLKPADLETIWQCTADELLRPDLCKVLCEVCFPLHSEEFLFFAAKIVAIPPAELCEEALDVIYEPTKTPNKTTEQLLKCGEMMASIALSPSYPQTIAEKALTKYAEMVTSLAFDPHKKLILTNCLDQMLRKVPITSNIG